MTTVVMFVRLTVGAEQKPWRFEGYFNTDRADEVKRMTDAIVKIQEENGERSWALFELPS